MSSVRLWDLLNSGMVLSIIRIITLLLQEGVSGYNPLLNNLELPWAPPFSVLSFAILVAINRSREVGHSPRLLGFHAGTRRRPYYVIEISLRHRNQWMSNGI